MRLSVFHLTIVLSFRALGLLVVVRLTGRSRRWIYTIAPRVHWVSESYGRPQGTILRGEEDFNGRVPEQINTRYY